MPAPQIPPWWTIPYTYIAGRYTPLVYDAARKVWVMPK